MCVSGFIIKDQISVGFFHLHISLQFDPLINVYVLCQCQLEIWDGARSLFILSNEKLFSFYITIQVPTFQRG